MDVLTLHIGQQKTGTTSLQATFRDNPAVLARHGLFYYGKTRTNHPLSRPFHGGTKRGADAKIVRDFTKEAKASGLRQALVSSETYIRLTDEEARECVATMGKVAGRVRVLLYVRDPVAFATSSVHQAVRTGRPLAEVAANPRVLPLRQLITRWRGIVGEDDMIVRPFDRAQLANGDVIDDVLSVLGCPAAAPELARASVNEGLSVLGIHLLDRANALMPDRRMSYDLQRPYNFIGGPRYVLPEEALRKVRRRAAPELAFLKDEYGIDLPQSDAPASPPLALSDEELASLARVFHEVNKFAFDLDRSAMGRVLMTKMPFSNRFGETPHPLRGKLERLGLLAELSAGAPDDGDGDRED